MYIDFFCNDMWKREGKYHYKLIKNNKMAENMVKKIKYASS